MDAKCHLQFIPHHLLAKISGGNTENDAFDDDEEESSDCLWRFRCPTPRLFPHIFLVFETLMDFRF